LPAFAECASAAKVATLVVAVVRAVTDPVQAVPGAATVQAYVRASPARGAATDGPPAAKSVVIFRTTDPVPPASVVRILYVKLVVPV